MAYIGNIPAEAYISISSQTFTTINGTGYTLSSSVESSEDIALFLNNVRQKPSTYTATGTSLTMGTATTTADELYCVYLGKALQTVNPGADSVGTSQIADLAVTTAKLAGDAVTTAKVLDSNVTYAKIQDTTTANRVIGAATAGVVSEVQVVDDMTNFVSTASAPGVTIKGDGTTDGYLQLNCDQNSHGVKIKSPAHSAAQSYTLTLPATAPVVNKFIETDASGNLSFSSVDVTTDITGTVPTANLGTGTASSSTFLRGDQTYAEAGGGKVNQVIQTVDTTLRSMSSSSWTSTSISVTITPSASDSKILLNFAGYVGFSTGLRVLFAPYADVGGAGATIITIPGGLDGFMVVAANDTATYQCQSAHLNYLHSPATTSEIVYTMYWNNPGANTVYLGQNYSSANTCPTFFTATEILV